MRTLEEYVHDYNKLFVKEVDTILLDPNELIHAEKNEATGEVTIYAKWHNIVYKIVTDKNGLVIGFEEVKNSDL